MRESGILMHITSLPSPWGIGTMGRHAYAFVDFLKAAGQKVWQILPLNPTGYGDSPYQSYSAFAGNPYFIDLDTLVSQGLLNTQEIANICWGNSEDRVDYGVLYNNRSKLLRRAYERAVMPAEFDVFCKDNSDWLPDFALYMALKEHHGGQPWYLWEKPFKTREPNTLYQARRDFGEEIRFYSYIQYLFFQQWQSLKDYANRNGISIIGDVPIYVPLDSVDVWSNSELFQLNENLQPKAVAGCPPDAFSDDGQLWGNPLYNWDKLASEGYSWWLRRLAAAGRMYDTVRLDHFRGFEAYWAVPYGDTTAKNGCWIKGPGIDFLTAVQQQLPELKLIAEDLGFLTPEVFALRDAVGLPGMKVLQFAFERGEPSAYLPHKHIPNSVCYTGTHDNMPIKQWLESIEPDIMEYATAYMNLNKEEGYVWGVIRTALSSVADLCILQLQDCLELGCEARMNFPGTQTSNNWTWRVNAACLTDTLSKKLFDLTRLYGR